MHPEMNDGDLLQRMLAGDESAFTVLYRRHQDRVYRFAQQMTGSPGLAEEVTQEVFLTLMRAGKSFNSQRASLPSWLYGIARNYIHRCLERERPYVPFATDRDNETPAELPDTCSGEDVLTDFTNRETVEQVRRAILSLPASYRETVVLCELHELSYVEAAESLGCAVGTVRSRLHRARELLAERLKDVREKTGMRRLEARSCRRG
ncbi:MAG TPA: sigma-70 family RNA polymerase sigma factor [Terriglobales bacterium]|nr:sigma-70 family RNA polymerase sigma factor [Terriglobales bacterium]